VACCVPLDIALASAHISFDGTRSPRASSFSHREKGRAAARDEGLWPIDRPEPPHPGPLPSGEREQNRAGGEASSRFLCSPTKTIPCRGGAWRGGTALP